MLRSTNSSRAVTATAKSLVYPWEPLVLLGGSRGLSCSRWTPLEGRSGTESPNSWLGSKTRGGEEGHVIIVFKKISIIF